MIPPKTFSIHTAALCCWGIAVIVPVGSMVYLIAPKFYYMKSEYVTADVIRATDVFVLAHPGGWPHSWIDLGKADLSEFTDMRFDITAKEIAENKSLLYTAIQPKCHQYRTYPHANEQLDQLYDDIVTAKKHR